MAYASKPQSVRQHIAALLLSNRRHRLLLGIFTIIALLTSLIVANALSQNGIAMTHEETVLDCPVPGGEHTHTSDCYDEEDNLTCGREEHVHGPGCYTTITVEDEEPEAEVVETVSEPEPTPEPEAAAPAESQSVELEPQATEDLRPAQTLTDELLYEDDTLFMRVQVEAPQGALPAGTTLRIDYVDPASVQDKVTAELAHKTDEELAELQCVQLTFLDPNGAEVTATQQLTLRVISELARDHGTPHMLLINKDDNAKPIDILDKPALEARNLTPADDELIADADPQDLTLLALATTTPAQTPATTPEEPAAEPEAAPDPQTTPKPESTAPTTPTVVTNLQTLTYQDASLKVAADVYSGQLPEDARLQVTQITPTTSGYNYDAYMQALQATSNAPVSPENTLLYDVAIMSAGVEWEPTDGGHVDLSIQFKRDQLTEDLGVENAETVAITHLPVDSQVMEHYNTTREATDISADDIQPEAVDAVITSDAAELSFELSSLSTIAITNASSTVNVNVSLSGAYDANSMLLKNKNVYAYLVPSNGGSWIYGAKLDFAADGSASCTITGVPDSGVQDNNTDFDLVLAYKTNDGTMGVGRQGSSELNVDVVRKVAEGGTLSGFIYHEPTSYQKDGDTYTLNATLDLPEISNANFKLRTLMDTAINYGITANEIDYRVASYSNYATKTLNITNANANDGTVYGHRADNVAVVPNIIANINYDGLKLTSAGKPSNYYVTEKDQGKVKSTNVTDTIIRNDHEIGDRVEIMLSNTLKQAEELAGMNMATLPSTTSVDTTAYADGATIILDATAISGEQNGFTIYKRPGQTIVFNIGGANAKPPQNTKVVLVDDNGNQTGTYVAGDDMRYAPYTDGDVWNKLIWNFPDAPSVTATNQIGGIFLVPKGDFTAANKGGGWIVARGKVSVTNEWYGFPGDDEPFKQRVIRKTFVGVPAADIDESYAVKLWTHTNESTSGTTHEELITSLVLKPETDTSLIKDPSGATDQTGYHTTGTDTDGNVYYEWITPPLSVGNEHKVTEVNATTKNGVAPLRVEFTGPYSVWNGVNYEWATRSFTYTSADGLAGIFNVSRGDEANRKNVYVTNVYRDSPTRDLFVKKVVTGNEPSPKPSYDFVVSLVNEEGAAPTESATYQYVKKNLATGAEESRGQLTFTLVEGAYQASFNLTSNQQIEIDGLPKNWTYTLHENVPADATFTTAYEGGTVAEDGASVSGTLDRGRTVTVTNSYPVTTKDLVVTKTITDPTGVAFDALANQGFSVHVDNASDAQDTHELKLSDEGVSREAVTGGYRYTWTIKDVPVGAEYRVSERNADLDGYLRTSTVSVDGEAPHAIAGQERIVVRDTTDRQGAAFVNSYERVPESSTRLQAKKVFLDADGNALSLEAGQFSFMAQLCNENGGSADEGTSATNAVNGLVQFDELSGLDAGEYWYLLTETKGEREDVDYSTERYLAKVDVPEAAAVVTPDWVDESSNNMAKVTVTLPIEEDDNGPYLYRINKNGSAYTVNDGSIRFSLYEYNPGTYTYTIDQYYSSGSLSNQFVKTIGTLTTVVVDNPVDQGTWVRHDNVVFSVSYASDSSPAVAGEPTITYYRLSVDGKTELSSVPTFTNRLKNTTVKVTLQGKKVGVDDVVLAGAEFTLEGHDGTLVSGPDGLFAIGTELEAGDYYLTEIKAPDGYNLLDHRVKITVSADGTVRALSDVEGTATSYKVEGPNENGVITITIPNNPGVELPHTGGPGTVVYTVAGAMMITAGVLLFIARRRHLI